VSYDQIVSFVNSVRDLGLAFYTGVSASDVELFEKYAQISTHVLPGHLVDSFGMRVQLKYLKLGHDYERVLYAPPFPSDGFHAEAIEYAGVLRAFDQSGDLFNAVELGCGWGPWIGLAGVLSKRHGKQCRLVGVEGAPEHCAYCHEHLAENDLLGSFVIRQAVVGTDRHPKFFKSDTASTNDWGATPSGQANQGYEEVASLTLGDVIHGMETVDFMHIDIQGGELDLFTDFSTREVAKQRVKRLIVGTHSRTIEAALLENLKADGWRLESEKPCRFNYNSKVDYIAMTYMDGCQVWANPRFVD